MELILCEWREERFQVEVYCNGGAGWDVGEGQDEDVAIGRYAEGLLKRHGVQNERPAAIVRCAFGRGTVTLCGVHPELDVKGSARTKFVQMIAEAALHI